MVPPMNWLVVVAGVGLWLLVGALWLALDPGRLQVTKDVAVMEDAVVEDAAAAEERSTTETTPPPSARPDPSA